MNTIPAHAGRLWRLLFALWLCLVTPWQPQVFAQAAMAEPGDIASQPKSFLNSDRIRSTFGSYGVEVMQQNTSRRVSNLYSHGMGVRTCRTLAITQFHQPVPKQLSRAHQRILEGGSIGMTLREDGWMIIKTPLFTGEVPNGPGFENIAHLSRQDGRELALAMYDLSVERAGLEYRYVTITEIYHPDYLSHDEVISIYGSPPARGGDKARISSLLTEARELIEQPEPIRPERP